MHAPLPTPHQSLRRNVDDPGDSVITRSSVRRGKAPRSPQLDKLEQLDHAVSATAKDAERIKDRREQALAHSLEATLQAARNQQEQQRSFLYHTRWLQLRGFYALMCETMATVAKRPPMSPLSRGAIAAPYSSTKVTSLVALPNSPTTRLAQVTAVPPTATETGGAYAQHSHIGPASWLRDIANEFRRAFVTPEIALPQLEIAVHRALRVQLFAAPAFAEPAVRLKAVFQAFQHAETLKVDFRELLCALYVLDRWRAGESKLLQLWFDEFATVASDSSALAVRKQDVRHVLFSACEGSSDETMLAPFVSQLVALGGRISYVSKRAFIEYVVATPQLVETIKKQCWCRLTDDVRLAFYRDLFVQASSKLEHEQLRVRTEAALRLWRSHEPRRRIVQWQQFVADRRHVRRGVDHFRVTSARKMVAALGRQRARRQHMRDFVATASAQYRSSLLRWTLDGWQLFVASMQLLHSAALRRSVAHYDRVSRRKAWRALTIYYSNEKTRHAVRQAKIEAFVASRHRKLLRCSMHDWCFYYRRRKDVADADVRERALHYALHEQQQIDSARDAMAREDALSQLIERNARQADALAQQRVFEDATQRVFANRKLQQQADERTRLKQVREAQVRAEAATTWQHIDAKLSVEVRQTTLAWFATRDGAAAVRKEGTRIFDQDPKELQHRLLDDPSACALPGCRWQLQLEDYGGRFAKPFYLNSETFEKLMCDELVLEQCEAIAKEVLVQRRIDAARQQLQHKAAAVEQQRRETVAAQRIQGMFRCHHALRSTRSLIRATFVKRVDPSTGDAVYLNVRRVETRRRPPRLIGSDEPLIPVESMTWVRRIDDKSNTYYVRIDASAVGSGGADQPTTTTWSWTPPPHYIMCAQCHVNFATRRCNESGTRLCIGCYADGLRTKRLSTMLTWTKLVVQPATCIVCRHASATSLCHECRGDVTCACCSAAVHRNAKLLHHTQFDDLTHAYAQ